MSEILIENHGSSGEDVYPLLVLTVWRPEASKLWLYFFYQSEFYQACYMAPLDY